MFNDHQIATKLVAVAGFSVIGLGIMCAFAAIPLALLSLSIALLLVPLTSFAVAPMAFAAHRHR